MKKIFLLIIFVILLSRYIPIKNAVTQRELEQEKQFLLVKTQKSTGYEWYVVGDNSGHFSQGYDIVLYGNVPCFEIPHPIAYAGTDNTFVCFGEYKQNVYNAEQWSRTFEVDSWSILYPIKRDGLLPGFLYPKYGLTIWD